MSTYSLLFLLLPLFFSSAQATQCYCYNNNAVTLCSSRSSNCGPQLAYTAGGAQLCCAPGDTCGQDNVCHTKGAVSTTGYYFGGCTDPLMKDPACSQRCGDGTGGEIVYSASTNSWSCCKYTNQKANCSQPVLDATFQLFAPVQYSAVATAIAGGAKSITSGTSSVRSSTSSSTSSKTTVASTKSDTTSSATATAGATTKSYTTPTATDTGVATSTADGNGNANSDTDGKSGNLAPGAKVGIAVGASILAVGLGICSGVWVLLRRRRRRAAQQDDGLWRPQNGFAELKDPPNGVGTHFSPELAGRVAHWEQRPAVHEAPVMPWSPQHIRIEDGGMELARLRKEESRIGHSREYAAELPG